MSKYIKTVWEDRIVQYPNRYKDQNGNILFLTHFPGNVSKSGTLVDSQKMNNIEDGIETLYQSAVDKDVSNLTNYYNKNEIDNKLGSKENTLNKVTTISSTSTNAQYPSALSVYNYVNAVTGDINSVLESVLGV